MKHAPAVHLLTLVVLAAIPIYFLAGGSWDYSALLLRPDSNDNMAVTDDLETVVLHNLPYSLELEQLGLSIRLAGGQREQNGIFISSDGLMRNTDAPIEPIVQSNTEALEEFARRMNESSGGKKTVYFALIPTACGVLRENLPRFAEGETVNQQRLIEGMYNRLFSGVRTIDVFSTLYNRRDQYLYYRTDNNLTSMGAYYSYTALARRMEISNRSLSQFDIEYVDHAYYGDLYRAPAGATGNWSGQTTPYRNVRPDQLALFRYSGNREYMVTQTDMDAKKTYHTMYPYHRMALTSELDIYLGGSAAVTDIHSSAPARGSLLVFGDRTASMCVPFLANHYRQVTLVDFYYARKSDLQQIVPEEYDQVLFLYGIESYMHTRNPARSSEIIWKHLQ